MCVSPTLSHGGAERFVSTLLCHLDRAQISPYLSLFRDEVTYPLPDDVPVTVLNKHRAWQIPSAISRLRRRIREVQPDVLLGNMTFTNWFAARALRKSGVECRMLNRFANNPQMEYSSAIRMLTRPIFRATLLNADAWVANSTGLARSLESHFQLPTGFVQVIFNPVDFERVEEMAEEPIAIDDPTETSVVVAVGRLTRQKRFDLLIDAFAEVRREVRCKLWICGEGPLRAELERRAQQLDLKDEVEFLGFQPNPYPYIKRASLFVLTSDHEGMPNALIEAQGLGLAAVSTSCPTGPDEVIEDGKTGYLVPPGDARSIAEKIKKLLLNEERRHDMGNRAAFRVREMFACGTVTRRWQDMATNTSRAKLASTN